MKCTANDCYAQAKKTSNYCPMHEAEGTFAFSYQEWDEERWNDRVELLHKMWEQDESAEQKKRLIADLIIHAHDISEINRKTY